MAQSLNMERIIGRYTSPHKGPLLICFGGMHGNEQAGVKALETVFHLLEREPLVNPDFNSTGRLLGLRGNRQASSRHKRYFEHDLNRLWRPDVIERVRAAHPADLRFEELELRELIECIEREVADYQPDQLIVLDLHTTTADGGIFGIATDDPESIRIAKAMHAPVITGMLKGLQGTVLHYFNAENFPCPTVAAGFEAGQHDDPLSINRCIAAIINCMRTVGCVDADDVENRHDELLIAYSEGLPKVAELRYIHRIKNNDEFRMEPGYRNFQPVVKGEVLAYDRFGPVQATEDALILMPLYQSQGDDGFFLVKPSEVATPYLPAAG